MSQLQLSSTASLSLGLLLTFFAGQEISTFFQLSQPSSVSVPTEDARVQIFDNNTSVSPNSRLVQLGKPRARIEGPDNNKLTNITSDHLAGDSFENKGYQISKDPSRSITTIVGGWARQNLRGRLNANVSILSARIGNSKPHVQNGGSSWESISLLVAVGSHDEVGDGCLEWDFESEVSLILTVGARMAQLEGRWSNIRRQKMWPAKFGSKSVLQLCFGFVTASLPNNDELLRRSLFDQRVPVQLIHYLPGRPEKIAERRKMLFKSKQKKIPKRKASAPRGDETEGGAVVTETLGPQPSQKSTLDFLLEARRSLPRPQVSLCLDALFGDVNHAVLEFLSYYKLIGVNRIFLFDDTKNPQLRASVLSLNDGGLQGVNASSDVGSTGPFIHYHSRGVGQFSFGSPSQRALIGYGARELAMTYCAAETATEPRLDTTTEKTGFDDAWLFVDIGLDEFLDCPSLALTAEGKELIGEAKADAGKTINKFVNHRRTRCRDRCLEVCLMRYKFGSVLKQGTKTQNGNDVEESALLPSPLFSTTETPSLLMEKYSRSQIGHTQAKCLIRPGPVLDLNLSIEVHGTLRQPKSLSCREPVLPRSEPTKSPANPFESVRLEDLHCKFGAHFQEKATSSSSKWEKSVVCRLNHFRPQFYTNCGGGGTGVCDTFAGQRSVYVAPSVVESSIGWAVPSVRAAVAAAASAGTSAVAAG